MKYSVSILDSAIEDIRDRVGFVRERFGNRAAEETYAQLKAKLRLLASHPHLGTIPPELSDIGMNRFRLLVHESHTKIFYELNEGTREVTVHLVFSSNQDFQTLLYRRIIRP